MRLSIFFFLHFTPYSSYMTILTQIYEQADLPGIGPISLSCVYFFFMLSTIVAPAVKWPLKTQFLIAGVCYTLSYVSGIFAELVDEAGFKYAISSFGSCLTGSSAGLLWVSSGRYIHLACIKYGEMNRKGEMYSIYNTAYCLTNVSAGLITTFGLGFFDAMTYFYITTIIGCIATIYCYFFIRNISEEDIELIEQTKNQAESLILRD